MRKRKLYYVPGLISLLGLPVLLYFLGPREPPILTAVKIYLPNDNLNPDPPEMIRFSKWYVYQSLKHKKIVTVDLDDDAHGGSEELYRFRQLKKLDFISNEVARRQFTHDTTSVFKIQFGEDCNYGNFIWVLNQARLYDVKRFVFIDDAYYLFTNPPPPPEQPLQDLKLYLGNDVIIASKPAVEKGPSRWEVFKAELGEWWEKAILIVERSIIYVLGFLLLIIFPTIVWQRSSSHHS
jgi:hypothetical protein